MRQKFELSPIQKEVNRTAKINVILAILMGFSFLFITLLVLGLSLLTSLLFMIGVILSLVPEGLQVTITLSLSLSAITLAKKNVLVKQLPSVHTLGSISVICTDKTGTLTQNEMMVEKLWSSGKNYNISGEGYNPNGQIFNHGGLITNYLEVPELKKIAECCIATAHSSIEPPEKNPYSKWRAIGDTTDAASLVLGLKIGLTAEDFSLKYKQLDIIPFDYQRKLTTTIHQYSPNQCIIYTKGAVESILFRTTSILWNNEVIPLTQELYQEVLQQLEHMASNGYRILALGEKIMDISQLSLNKELIETDFTFIGLLGILDPPRIGVPEAVASARKAGIKVIMITGDHKLTAENIARKCGIITSSNPLILKGYTLAQLKDEKVMELLDSPEILFARMNPEQKLKIVTLFKKKGEIVAVTGDGVNDVPALYAADIGISMGITGTQVAMEASQMVLLDDNFASIVKGVEGGRAILDNLKRYMKYVFTHNWAQLVGFLVLILWDIPILISVVIILSIDLIMEIPPSFAIILEPPEKDTLNHPPSKDTHLFTFTTLIQSVYIGLIIGAYSLFNTLQAYHAGGWVLGMGTVPDPIAYSRGITLYLVGIMAGQIGNLLASRTNVESAFHRSFFHNKSIFIAIGIELFILCSIVYIPLLQNLFNTTALTLIEFLTMFILTLIIFLIEELRKFVLRNYYSEKKV